MLIIRSGRRALSAGIAALCAAIGPVSPATAQHSSAERSRVGTRVTKPGRVAPHGGRRALGIESVPGAADDDSGCRSCHGQIENITESMGFEISCVFCHGGNGVTKTKEGAHVQPSLPVIMDNTVPPLDYDLAYQKFVNPTNLRVVDETCGGCHLEEPVIVRKSLMATAAGHYAGGLYQNGVVDTKTPIYGTFGIVDDDGYVPSDRGAVAQLLDLIVFDPTADPSSAATHFAAVPAQACARCHLWSRGKGYRGAVGAEGVYRADGCAACHMLYANDGRSLSADPSIDHVEQGHPMYHRVTKAIPSEQCIHCHHRGARIGLSFTGRAQMPPRLPSGPGIVGTTDVRFNGNYHISDPAANPPDVHHEKGLHCIDCHVKAEIMGDGNMYGHMDQATKIECHSCHGTPTEPAGLVDNDGNALRNLTHNRDGQAVLTSKIDGNEHVVPAPIEFLDPDSPKFNRHASCAMTDRHIKPEGGLECYACHAYWTPNCFGCHFERDERLIGLNLVTRQEEIGKARTNNKIFESLKHFSMGPNSSGRIAPYIVGCQPIADVTAPDGSKILDFKMPETVNGLSGAALDPVHAHTVRGRGQVRSCAECHRSPPSLGLGSGNYSIARDFAFVAADDGVRVYDRRTDRAAPTLVGTLSWPSPTGLATLPNVVEGTADFLYVASVEAGLAIYDLREGLPPAPETILQGIRACDVSRAGDHLYVVDEGTGVRIYENKNPVAVELVATVTVPGALRAVPWGIHLFVAAGTNGLTIVDISMQQTPAVVATVDGMNAADVRPYAHFRDDNRFAARAYVADPDFGIHFVDLLPDFASAKRVGRTPLKGATGLDTYTRYVVADAGRPSAEHDYLYVAAGANGLAVFDITDPDDVVQVSSLGRLGGSVVGVDVASDMTTPPGVDDYAVLANASFGMQLVNVTDPTDPVLIATMPARGCTKALVEVQQLDRFIDEQGRPLKENSHPNVETLTRADIIRILSADISCANDLCHTAAECDDRDPCTFDHCEDAECVNSASRYGDAVGAEGVCSPDGIVDFNDVWAVLNAFAGRYDKECRRGQFDIASADADGCAPDGRVDIRDVFAVLDALLGNDTCCPSP